MKTVLMGAVRGNHTSRRQPRLAGSGLAALEQDVQESGRRPSRLQHIATTATLNLDRIAAWFAGSLLAPTRASCFAALAA